MPGKVRTTHTPGTGGHGMAVDIHSRPVIDPTENVIALTAAANKRQDDLRTVTRELVDRDLAHIKELAAIRAEHQRALDAKESGRLDAIRQVDREEVIKAAASAQQAIATLAASTSTVAETLRAAQAQIAAASENRQVAFASEMSKRMSAVELSLSEGKGKQTVVDPQLVKLTDLVETLARTQAGESARTQVTDPRFLELATEINRRLITVELALSEGKGKQAVVDPQVTKLTDLVETLARSQTATTSHTTGMTDAAKLTIGAVGLLLSVLTIGSMIFAGTRTLAGPAAAPTPPQVIYVPAPPGSMLPTTPPQPAPR